MWRNINVPIKGFMNWLTKTFITELEITLRMSTSLLFRINTNKNLSPLVIQCLEHTTLLLLKSKIEHELAKTPMRCMWADMYMQLMATWKCSPDIWGPNVISTYSNRWKTLSVSRLAQNAINLLMLHRNHECKIPHNIQNELTIPMHHFTLLKGPWTQHLKCNVEYSWNTIWRALWTNITTTNKTCVNLQPLETDPKPVPTIGNVLWKQWIGREVIRPVHNNHHKKTCKNIRKTMSDRRAQLLTKLETEANRMWNTIRDTTKTCLAWVYQNKRPIIGQQQVN